MTGWRIGWMVLPEHLVRPIERLAQNLYICAPELSQIAACRAFDSAPELETIRQGYRKNRDLLIERLPQLKIPFASPPDGAFYAWCDVSAHTNDSMDFAQKMLNEIHVAAAPGLDFDTENGGKYMRFSYAGEHEVIKKAIDRMEDWLA
jgi:aspartate/methionine/tyrosine aminotransferase